MNNSKSQKDWDKFLDSDGIKSNLIRSSLYLFSYELLKRAIVDKIKDFYIVGFNENGYVYEEEYNEKVVNRKVNGKQNIFMSSLKWLEESEAIIQSEVDEISQIREARNIIAHNLDKILTDSDYNIDEEKEKRIFELISKIEKWWISEVEIPTDPEFDNKEIDSKGIVSGTEIFYTYIKNISDELLKKE